jgi:hypothetical protein
MSIQEIFLGEVSKVSFLSQPPKMPVSSKVIVKLLKSILFSKKKKGEMADEVKRAVVSSLKKKRKKGRE